MLTLYDYLPSQNAWKVRQLLHHLQRPYRTEIVSLFEGHGQREDYLAINPWGAVPAIRLDDGRVLSESNAILWYLSGGTPFRPADHFAAAKVMQWLSFEADYVQASIGSLQYWALTGKLAARHPSVVDGKRELARRALKVLDGQFAGRPFIAGPDYTIADISIFAYAHRAEAAGVSTDEAPHFEAWLDRVRSRPDFLAEIHFYDIDPHAAAELP
jgi:glutathione S-transferase